MAKQLNGILDAFSGACGNVVGYRGRHGEGYVRSRPSHYNDRKSKAQLRNRGKMDTLMAFESAAKEFIKANLGNYAVGMSEVNYATKLNFKKAVFANESASRFWIEMDKISLSEGFTAGVDGLRAVVAGNRGLLHWTDNSMVARAKAEDRLQVFLFNEEKIAGRYVKDTGLRGDLSAWVEVPESWAGERMHVFVAFVSRGGESSKTGYVSLCGSCVWFDSREGVGLRRVQSATWAVLGPYSRTALIRADVASFLGYRRGKT